MPGNGFTFYLLDSRPGRRILIPLLLFCVGIGAAMDYSQQDCAPICGCASGEGTAACIDLATPEHSCGKPAGGTLVWENGAEFRLALAECGLSLRLAAFQITAPDPTPGEKKNVALAADRLAGKIILPGEVFSMNRTLGPYTLERGFQMGRSYQGTRVVKTAGGGVCKVASALFNAVILADLPVVERHAHSMLVPYVPPAQDAAVVYGARDFRFRNDTAAPILIWADTVGSTLYLALYGAELSPKVTWHHEIITQQEQPTYYYRNRNMEPGQSRVVSPGTKGLVVKSWLTIERTDGSIESKDMGICRYRPMPRIVERG